MISYSAWSFSHLVACSLLAQMVNVSFWKCFKIGGMILSVIGFFQWSFVLDHMSEAFLIFCTFIGMLVLYFSGYYMSKKEINLFSCVIFLFITSMLMLVTSSNMMTMFIGWEGVGVISFILIGWFMEREKAVSASFYAFMYNRVADFFFLVLLLWEIGGQHSLFYINLFAELFIHNNNTQAMVIMISISLWVATAGKSAQFFFHPWLTLAMEGPTPVSSLLHSSTMVVAGVYLLLKLHPLIVSLGWLELNSFIIFSSMLTMVMTSMWAMSQSDIKKIIALSTTSQLSLMMMLCCTGHYDLAFMHMIFHGFFKALLFLGSGITIHNNPSNNQDITKLNLLLKSSTFLHTVFVIGVLGLMGASFMGSFYSKHLVFDLMQWINLFPFTSMEGPSQVSYSSVMVNMGLYMSPIMTLGYSLKLLSFISQKVTSTMLSSSYISNSIKDLEVIIPLTSLAILSFILGPLLSFNLVSGWTTLLSQEDIFFSFFLLVMFLGFLFYILWIIGPSSYLYNSSGFIIKLNMLYLRNLLLITLFQMVEYLSLKKGVKLMIPLYSSNNSEIFWITQSQSLKSSMLINLLNLATMIPLLAFYFILLYIL